MAHRQVYQVFATALGPIGLVWDQAGLTRVQLPAEDAVATAVLIEQRGDAAPADGALPADVAAAIEALHAYATGTPVHFADVRLSFDGLPVFHARIYRALRDVPWGATTTYGALAKAVGDLGAARAVGMAMGRNPWPIIVPCHRVLAAGRRIGGFSAPGGSTTKQKLLRLEGAAWDGDAPLLPGLLD